MDKIKEIYLNRDDNVDVVDLGLSPEKEALLLAIDIHINFLKFLEMVKEDKKNAK